MTVLPIFRSTPARDVGIPVVRATCCFALVMPSALFKEKLRPGIFVFDIIIEVYPIIKILSSLPAGWNERMQKDWLQSFYTPPASTFL